MNRSYHRTVPLLALTVLAVAGLLAVDGLPGGSGTAAAAGAATTTKSSGMPGMSSKDMGSTSSGRIPTVNGMKPVSQMPGMPMVMAITPIGSATWQGMRIEARVMAPSTFILVNAGKQQMVKATGKDSFHLMVLLNDAKSGTPIPYSSVWATITKGNMGTGKPVFDERLWPMISQTMGVHYGINVPLPSAGTYHLALLISPPAVARHMEYDNRWLKPHKVGFTFNFKPAA
jgi:Fe2+ transport protein